MLNSNYLINPIIQGETAETLMECSNCLAYISQSAGNMASGDIETNAFLGLRTLLECVHTAIEYESQRTTDLGVITKPSSD